LILLWCTSNCNFFVTKGIFGAVWVGYCTGTEQSAHSPDIKLLSA
jgi:hypothetical protein